MMTAMAPATCATNEKLRRTGRRRQRQRWVTTDAVSFPSHSHSMTSESTRVVRRRAIAWRWLWPAAACVAVVVSRLSTAAAAIPTSATMSATTTDDVTYCWQVDGSVYSNNLPDSTQLQTAQQNDCPLELSMQLPKDVYYVNEAIQATWTATLNRDTNGTFANNTFGVQQLYVAEDRISQRQCEIVYSRIESCSASATNCDPVTGETTVAANVANKAVNFTTSGLASFSTNKLAFTTSGSVKLIAHLILPGENPESQRYDFALYRTITINDRPTLAPVKEATQNQSQTTASASKDKGMSTEVIGILFVCGMVAVALVAVGFTVMRKGKASPPVPSSVPDKGPEGRTRYDATSTALDDEFVMLSNEETLMQSQRPRGNTSTFLSATAAAATAEPSMMEESRAKAKAKAKAKAEGPLAFVGASSSQQQPQQQRTKKTPTAEDDDLVSDEHTVDTSNPASMRHKGHYMEMQPQLSAQSGPSRMPASTIGFNDIQAHEILRSGTSSSSHRRATKIPPRGPLPSLAASSAVGSSAMSPFVTGRSPRAEALASHVATSEVWRVSTELTFDDLRESVDRGPALTIDDLLETRQISNNNNKKKKTSVPRQPIVESSES